MKLLATFSSHLSNPSFLCQSQGPALHGDEVEGCWKIATFKDHYIWTDSVVQKPSTYQVCCQSYNKISAFYIIQAMCMLCIKAQYHHLHVCTNINRNVCFLFCFFQKWPDYSGISSKYIHDCNCVSRFMNCV